jgi:hypothetical protein
LKPTLVTFTEPSWTPASREDGAEVGRLVRQSGGAHAHSREVARRADLLLPERDDRCQRLLDDGADADQVPCSRVAGQQQLGLVGDRHVRSARAQELEGRGRVRRRLDPDVEPGAAIVARRLGGIDAGVIGVGEVVEHQVEALELGGCGSARGRLLLFTAAGQHEKADKGADESAGHDPPGDSRVGAHRTRRRSSIEKSS